MSNKSKNNKPDDRNRKPLPPLFVPKPMDKVIASIHDAGPKYYTHELSQSFLLGCVSTIKTIVEQTAELQSRNPSLSVSDAYMRTMHTISLVTEKLALNAPFNSIAQPSTMQQIFEKAVLQIVDHNRPSEPDHAVRDDN